MLDAVEHRPDQASMVSGLAEEISVPQDEIKATSSSIASDYKLTALHNRIL